MCWHVVFSVFLLILETKKENRNLISNPYQQTNHNTRSCTELQPHSIADFFILLSVVINQLSTTTAPTPPVYIVNWYPATAHVTMWPSLSPLSLSLSLKYFRLGVHWTVLLVISVFQLGIHNNSYRRPDVEIRNNHPHHSPLPDHNHPTRHKGKYSK